MLKYVLIFALIFNASLEALCQFNSSVSILDETNPGLVLKEFKPASTGTQGTIYVDEEWNMGSFVLKSKKRLSNYPLRLDIQNKLLEIKYNNEIKVCGPNQLESFEWVEPKTQQQVKYINADKYKDVEGTPIIGFLEIVIDNNHSKLLAKEYLKLKKANYVATVDMGSREDKIIKEESYFMSKNNTLYRFSSKKDKNLSLFGEDKDKMKQYVEDNKLKFNNRVDLIKIITHYNSL